MGMSAAATDIVSRSTNRKVTLPGPSEVAAALGMGDLPEVAYLYARVGCLQDEACINPLVDQLTEGLIFLFAEKQWGAERAHEIACMLTFELFWRLRCPRCNGTGEVPDREVPAFLTFPNRGEFPTESVARREEEKRGFCRVHYQAIGVPVMLCCRNCGGTGRAHQDKTAAQWLRIAKNTYSQRWKPRVQAARKLLMSYELQVMAHVEQQFNEDPDQVAV